MNRISVTVIFIASLTIGFALWLAFDRFFVREQNQLFARLDKGDSIDASVVAARGGWFVSLLWWLKHSLIGLNAGRRLTMSQRRQLFELPDIIDLLNVAVASGESLFAAISRVANKTSGQVAEDLKRLVVGVELGSTLAHELKAWSARANSRQVSELCTKLQISLERGTPLAEMLTDQARAMRLEVNQVLKRRAAQNETRMLVPLIFLILPITVIFAVYPSIQVLTFTQ